MSKLAINGFGRIGRTFLRTILDKESNGEVSLKDFELVAVNDLAGPKTLAHLLKYDSVYGILKNKIEAEETSDPPFTGKILVDGYPIKVISQKEPEKLPWKKMAVSLVLESSGKFTKQEEAKKHLQAGAQKVIISAPPKGGNIETFILGVNSDKRSKDAKIISNSSCTTNSVAPVARVIEENFGINKALVTTVHAYTADQNLQDAPHKDLRRARAAAENIVPTTTGAAISTTEILPRLKGLFGGLALRVPVPVGSVSDFTFLVKKPTTMEKINRSIIEASSKPPLLGILTYTQEPIVSSDIIGNPHSSIVDLSLTNVVDGDLVKVVAWYDNEWGYSHRLTELVLEVLKEL